MCGFRSSAYSIRDADSAGFSPGNSTCPVLFSGPGTPRLTPCHAAESLQSRNGLVSCSIAAATPGRALPLDPRENPMQPYLIRPTRALVTPLRVALVVSLAY